MAIGVVQRLEIVQIDEQQCAFALAARTASQSLLKAVQQQAAVGQVRQRVKERQVLDLRLGPFAVSNVKHDGVQHAPHSHLDWAAGD